MPSEISYHQAEGTVAHVHQGRRAVFADSEAIEQILPFEEGLPRVAYVLVKYQPAVRCAQDEVLVSISVNICQMQGRRSPSYRRRRPG